MLFASSFYYLYELPARCVVFFLPPWETEWCENFLDIAYEQTSKALVDYFSTSLGCESTWGKVLIKLYEEMMEILV